MTPEQIVATTAALYDVAPDRIVGGDRNRRVVVARQHAMYALRVHTSKSLAEIGDVLGGLDHTTVLHGIRQAADRLGRPVPPPAGPAPKPRADGRTCSVDGCGRPYVTKGMCAAHYERDRRHGDPLAHIPIGALPTGRRPRADEPVPTWDACESCGGTPLAGGRWCGVGRCARQRRGRWSWSGKEAA